MNISLSIVIPVFNEERRLKKTFSELKEFFANNNFKYTEVIFVNDGSIDKTKEIIEDFNPEFPVQLISYKENRGKGYAVRCGMLSAKNDYSLILDSDMSTSLHELAKMAPFIEKGYPVIIGTRKVKGAKMIPPQPWLRKKLGEGYTVLANLVTGAGVSDFTCGFKVFSKTARDKIFNRAQIDRWSYDAEILYLAKKYKLDVCEVPVIWRNDTDTRVKLGRDILGSFIDLIKIRFRRQ